MTLSYVQPAPLAPIVAELRRGDVSLTEYLAAFRERFDTIEPQLQAFVREDGRFERLAQEAAALQTRFPDASERPPLYGVLVGIKDVYHVDGIVTRAGTALPPELFAGAQAAVVTRLKDAGALIAGKTVTAELAFLEPGPTRNPHNLNHTPGGSSSGSAAAVGAGLVPLAVGTQTVGSTIRPAAYCGIVGYKPTYERIDSAGVVYFSRSVDTVGLFTQDIEGMQLAASLLVNDWRGDIDVLEKPVLAVPDGPFLQQVTALEAFERQVQTLEMVGYEVKRIPVLEDVQALTDLHFDLIAAEFAHEHSAWFEQYQDVYRPKTADIIRRGQGVSAERLQQGRENRLTLREHLHQLMREHSVDLWVCPSAPDAAPEGIASTGNSAMNLPFTHAGLPCISVPVHTGGLPLGLQLVGAFGDDERLLAWSHRIAGVVSVSDN